jgi:fatty acid desaturase
MNHQNESARFFEELPPQLESEVRALYRLRPMWNLMLLVYPLVWIAAIVVMDRFPLWPVLIAGWIVIAASLTAMGSLMHEAVHASLFRRPGLDRWVGFGLAALGTFSYTAYKMVHLRHHRYNRGAGDPDEITNYTPDRRAWARMFWQWWFLGAVIYGTHLRRAAKRLGTPAEHRVVALELAAVTGVVVLAVLAAWWTGRFDMLLHGYVMPLGVGSAFLIARGYAEHALTPAGDPWTQTLTVTSNWFVRFGMCNLNFHLEHHLCPGMPWYNLPRLHRLLADERRRRGVCVKRSYILFLWQVLRAGPEGAQALAAPVAGAAGEPLRGARASG